MRALSLSLSRGCHDVWFVVQSCTRESLWKKTLAGPLRHSRWVHANVAMCRVVWWRRQLTDVHVVQIIHPQEPNTGNYQVQIGETNVQIQLDTSDFVPAFAYVPPPGVDVGKYVPCVVKLWPRIYVFAAHTALHLLHQIRRRRDSGKLN